MKTSTRRKIPDPKMMDGFYIEVRNRGSNERGIKLRSESRSDMEINAKQYVRAYKEVVVLGEYKNEVWLK